MSLQSALPLGDAQVPRGAAADGAAQWGCPRGRVLASSRRSEGSCRARAVGTSRHEGRLAVSTQTPPVLEGRDLVKSFSVKQGRSPLARSTRVHAVDNVTVRLDAGRVTALVGESGAGKTTVARMLAKITKPDAGEGLRDGQPAPSGRPRSYAAQVQMIFQDPFASLNPVHRIRHHLLRPLEIHHMTAGNVDMAIADLLNRVALKPADNFTNKFPYELSGGQRQRVAIARALAVRPRVLLADEPVSMLDVSIRLGVLNLLADLRDEEQLAILYVTHDIASARYLADTIVVMYAGELIESAPSVDLTDAPAHPYTQLL